MLDWKIGKVIFKGYCLQVTCAENVVSLESPIEENAYKLVLFKKGTTILNMNGKTIVITAPSVFSFNERDKVVWMNQKSEYEMDIIYFHPSVINQIFSYDNIITCDFNFEYPTSIIQDRFLLEPFFLREKPLNGIFNVEITTFYRMLQLFNKLHSQIILESDCFWPCRSRSYLIEILIILQMRYIDNSASNELLELNENQKEMEAVLEFLHSNYSSKITIEQITKHFNINRNSLNERFTKLTGYTPISYLNLHRLKVAESLLINTNVPVYEICDRVGINELSNFMKSFKRRYGHTPAQYRTLYTLM